MRIFKTRWDDFDYDDLESDYYEEEINKFDNNDDLDSYGPYVLSEETGEEQILDELREKDELNNERDEIWFEQNRSKIDSELNKKGDSNKSQQYLVFIMDKISKSEIKFFEDFGQAMQYLKKQSKLETKIQHLYPFSLTNCPIKVGFYISKWEVKGGLEKLYKQNTL
tara:strand:+ start:99 stop:599 length:501 start_codon:yes stop_codon:yes gene_type:complete